MITFAIETQRIAAASAGAWRTMLAGPSSAVTEQFIEGLATPLAPQPTTPRPAAGSDASRLTALVKAKVGLPPHATKAQVMAALDVIAPAKPAAVAASATASAAPLVNSLLNPAVYELATEHQEAYRDALAASGGSVPRLFGGSDLPAATASGIDPQRLAGAHWIARPAIAAATDVAEAEELLAMASGPGGEAVRAMPEVAGHPGVRGYLDDVRAFAEAGTAVMRRRQEDAQIAAARGAQLAAVAGGSPSPEDDLAALFDPGTASRIAGGDAR